MDVEKSFTYLFEDTEWPSKLGLGALIGMVPILNFAWTGYLVGILRNMMHPTVEPLPSWDDIDQKFRDGLILFAAGLVYALPILIPLLLPLGVVVFSGVSAGISNLQEIGRSLTEAGGAVFFCLACVLILYAALLAVLHPAILVLFARERTFASCFKLHEALAMIRKHAAAFFTTWAVSLVASLAVGLLVGFVNMVVGWVPCIGWIVGTALSLGSGVYLTAVHAHLFGQFGRMALQNHP
jgi:hypothetical protein